MPFIIKRHKPHRLPGLPIIPTPTTVWETLGIYLPYAINLPSCSKELTSKMYLFAKKNIMPTPTHPPSLRPEYK